MRFRPKSSKIGKSNSLSPHKKKRAQPPSSNGSRRHRHRASEGVRARLRATGEKMHETRPTRVYAHREQDGVRCVLSIIISSSSSSSSSLSFFVCPLPPFLSIFWGKSNTYISRRCLAGLTKKRSLSTSFKTRQGLSCLGSSGSS